MVILSDILQLIFCGVIAFTFSSLAEYWLHRLMHFDPQTFAFHLEHHQENTGQGFLQELRNYVLGTSLLIMAPFLYSWEIGLSWLLGAVSYAAFSAYAHQLQHDNPQACFWMPMPVHYVHHHYKQWHHNFGLGLDYWDRVFGTYKPVEWLAEPELHPAKQSLLTIKWW
jgi:sterol desaturase/sphingolipid hydroxylase (fatty acid hydroxylase superfamily)